MRLRTKIFLAAASVIWVSAVVLTVVGVLVAVFFAVASAPVGEGG